MVNPNTLSSISTLDIVPYAENTPGNYWPISALTGLPTTVGSADILKLSQTAPIDSNRPFVLRGLKPNKNYRIFGRAYNQENATISLDASSCVDVAVGNDDAPGIAPLTIRLADCRNDFGDDLDRRAL